MKLLTLNCHSWQEDDQIEKIRYLAKVIKEKQYDVIALQEVSQSINSKLLHAMIKEDNFVQLLIQELNKIDENKYNFIWDYSHIGYDIYEEGVAILTKHEIKDTKAFYISKSDNKKNYRSRKILSITVNVEGNDVDFYSCHTGWWNDDIEPFKYHADMLIENINNDRMAFVMGDFNNNAYVRNEGYDYLIELGLKDTYVMANEKDNGVTVRGKIAGWEMQEEDKRLDLILTNREIKVLESKVIFNGVNKDIISDHYGVEVLV
ncbi:endonuclease/exonuclease/phosphatase family protein [Clostridium sp. 1001271B_151109_B4]|uniref:endonuclease/exonuclease/phosphatase family protein n=1 Tax=Clostridium sp. 1001271B_151109_B4 TaxID=2787148 RepID=UPI0018AB1547|nr:endonuclease/exonuclease/phosphatase family protein [Clostridium sp. 1001271B_151109_B4]